MIYWIKLMAFEGYKSCFANGILGLQCTALHMQSLYHTSLEKESSFLFPDYKGTQYDFASDNFIEGIIGKYNYFHDLY